MKKIIILLFFTLLHSNVYCQIENLTLLPNKITFVYGLIDEITDLENSLTKAKNKSHHKEEKIKELRYKYIQLEEEYKEIKEIARSLKIELEFKKNELNSVTENLKNKNAEINLLSKSLQETQTEILKLEKRGEIMVDSFQNIVNKLNQQLIIYRNEDLPRSNKVFFDGNIAPNEGRKNLKKPKTVKFNLYYYNIDENYPNELIAYVSICNVKSRGEFSNTCEMWSLKMKKKFIEEDGVKNIIYENRSYNKEYRLKNKIKKNEKYYYIIRIEDTKIVSPSF